MPEKQEPGQPLASDQKKPADALVIDAKDLFRGGREIWIEHGGVRYRLRITRRNKLILQK